MKETFEIIEKMPKNEQLSILLELLQEKSGAVALLRNRFNSDDTMKSFLETERINCEWIKNKLKTLFNNYKK